MRKFKEFAVGLASLAIAVFFSVATYVLVVAGNMAQEKIPHYEALWSRGWDDFNTISASIRDLNKTTAPFVEIFPELVRQVDEMNDTVHHMDTSVSHMDKSVTHLSRTVPPQMGVMSGQMGQMRQNMTPGGMMRKMMPWQ